MGTEKMKTKKNFKKAYMMCDIKKPKKKNGKLVGEELSLSWDTNDEYNRNKVAVIFYKPQQDDFNHFHIEFTDEQIKKMEKWIKGYLKMKERMKELKEIKG